MRMIMMSLQSHTKVTALNCKINLVLIVITKSVYCQLKCTVYNRKGTSPRFILDK
jgi:hypothetical protein